MPDLPHLENLRHLLTISSVVPLPGPMDTVSRVQLFAAPWTIACQAPLSMEFFRQGYWSGLLVPSPGDLPDPGIELGSTGRSPGERIGYSLQYSWAFLVAQLVKNLPAMQETWVRSLGWEDPLEKGKATHSSILAWRIPWTILSMGSQRVGHD